jgi:hypothetical protein
MNTLGDRYRWHREHSSTIVGEHAVSAIALARAEIRAEQEGLEFRWENELESYEDVYGDEPEPGVEYLWCGVYAEETEDELLASLGFIGVRSPAFAYGVPRDPYIRTVQAELALEALDRLDEERSTWARAEEARRPDLYNGGEAL